ncbi:MAG: hypothetical protein NZ571_10540 [Anaerolineae bacterium]|nr:hypothetical protein [Anaerolineae bacterium]
MDQTQYQAVRRRVVRRFRRRALFWPHLIGYAVYYAHVMSTTPWYIPAVQVWLPVLIVHALFAFEVPSRIRAAWDSMVERMVERELQKSRATDSKPKREALALGDDGELVPLEELTADESALRKRHERSQ